MRKNWCVLLFFIVFFPMLLGAEFHVCTVASHASTELDQLLISADKQGMKIEVLGYNQPYKSNVTKLIRMQEYLKDLPDSDIVMLVDAYDVLIMTPKKTLIQKFLAMNAPFVISVERNCWPDAKLASKYPPAPTSFKYLNAGSWIGYVFAIKQILKDVLPARPGSDQRLLTLHYLKNPEQYKLDYFCELFLPLMMVEEDELIIDPSSGLVLCKETNTVPCIIHGNGSGKQLYQHIFNLIFRGHD